MAIKATIFKCELVISDLERQYYATHNLTIARHPSETDERMMLRILMFVIHAHEQLEMTKGISTDDEPDLWQKSLSGEIEHWIELGQPEEKRLRQASGRARKVTVLTYGSNAPVVWWQQNQARLSSIGNLDVWSISNEYSMSLVQLTERTMRLQATLDAGHIWLTAGDISLELSLEQWQ